MSKLVILGAGESGVGAALLAKKLGSEVFVSDYGQIAPAYQDELTKNDIEFESGQHTAARILEADEVIKSPGIPDTAPLIKQLMARQVPIISEIEFAARQSKARLIGVTGSNGKTTTVTLLHHLLQTAGLKVTMAGNIGKSFARQIVEGEPDCVVLELSSFQLEGVLDFRPHIAMILNVTADHLDRYDYDMTQYAAAKFRIAENQTSDDLLLTLRGDTYTEKLLAKRGWQAGWEPISCHQIEGTNIRVEGQPFELSTTKLRGRHNALNALFAVRAAMELQVEPAIVQLGLNTFQSVPHRLEVVGQLDGVEYINDSKATNVDAVFFALQAMDRPIVWIAGGTDKGNDYSMILPLAEEKVKALICLGVDNEKLKTAFSAKVPEITETQTVETAIAMVQKAAAKGDVVLLSPACASFDLFKNYIDRGDQFRSAVHNLIKSQKGK